MNNKNLKEEFKKKRNNYLLGLCLLAAIGGCLNAFLYDRDRLVYTLGILNTLGAIILIYLWIIYDAKFRSYRIPQYIKYIIVLIGLIGVPMYFWRTRNTKDFWINIGGLWLFAVHSIIYSISANMIAQIFI